MPYINTKTNIEIPSDKGENIKSRLGKAAAIIGKSEAYLMVNMEDNCRLYFGGDKKEPAAFVEIRLFGKSTKDAYAKMTKAVCDIVSEELGISGNRIYVQYEEVPNWGFNGRNF